MAPANKAPIPLTEIVRRTQLNRRAAFFPRIPYTHKQQIMNFIKWLKGITEVHTDDDYIGDTDPATGE